MTKLTTANKKKLTHMNRASHNVDLGDLLATMESGSAAQAIQITTLLSASATLASGSAANAAAITALQAKAVTSGSVSVSSAQASASAVVINSGLGSIKGYMVQIYRSGSSLTDKFYTTNSSGSLSILPVSGSYAVTTSDLIEYILW